MNLFNPAQVSTSFEDGTTLGWAGAVNVASLASVVGNAEHGSRSMRVTGTAAGAVDVRSVLQPCTPGSTYSVGFYITTTLAVQCFVYWYNSAGGYLSGTGGALGAPSGGAARLVLNNVTAPASGTQLKVAVEVLAVPAGGSFYLDAVQYEQATVATAYVPPPGSPPLLTEVHLTFRDGAGQPRPRVHAGARVLSPAGYLLDDPEVVRPTATFSDPAGLVSLPLIASSQYTQPGTLYEVRYDGRTRRITVPDNGPVDMADVLVLAPNVADVASDADWILTSQLLDGGIAQYPDKAYMVPYFSHFAALGLARATEVTGNPVYTAAAWDWLDWYAAHMDANGFVTDYGIAADQTLTSTGSYDSTDSYAAMFLLAAHKTWTVTGDNPRLSALSAGLAGAVTAIEATQQADGLTWATPAYHVKLLMDQVEVYAGLQAAYDMATALGNTLQSRALTASNALVAGVETMWNSGTSTYNWAKFENGTQSTCNWSVDYPDATAQVWPVAFGLVRGSRAAALVNKYDIEQPLWNSPMVGWAFMQAGKMARARAAAASRRAESISTNRASPWISASSGQLIVLESTDLSYLAPLTP